jgi:hypothetical protein
MSDSTHWLASQLTVSYSSVSARLSVIYVVLKLAVMEPEYPFRSVLGQKSLTEVYADKFFFFLCQQCRACKSFAFNQFRKEVSFVQPVKKFCTAYGTRSLITMFTGDRHWSLTRAMNSPNLVKIHWNIFSFVFQLVSSLQAYRLKFSMHLSPPMRAIWSTHPSWCDHLNRLWNSSLRDFLQPLLLLPFRSKNFSSVMYCLHEVNKMITGSQINWYIYICLEQRATPRPEHSALSVADVPGANLGPRHRLCLIDSVAFFGPPNNMPEHSLKTDHDCFLPNPNYSLITILLDAMWSKPLTASLQNKLNT